VNVFAEVGRTREVFTALPGGVEWSEEDVVQTETEGQVRLWWAGTPVDVFLNTTEFHDQVATRIRTESFAGSDVPFLSCTDLTVVGAFLNRTRDWADLEEMAVAGSLDLDQVLGALVRCPGTDDDRIGRLRSL
jgi:hypothetical protein